MRMYNVAFPFLLSVLLSFFGVSPFTGEMKVNYLDEVNTAKSGQEHTIELVEITNFELAPVGEAVETNVIMQGENYITIFENYPYDTFVARFETDGTLDRNFGENGIVLFENTWFASPQIDKYGNIVIVGLTSDAGVYNSRVCIYKLTKDGKFDVSFNSTGKLVYENSTNLIDYRIDEKNNIVLSASRPLDTTYSPMFQVIRFLPNGLLDKSFGDNGLFETKDGIAAIELTTQSEIVLYLWNVNVGYLSKRIQFLDENGDTLRKINNEFNQNWYNSDLITLTKSTESRMMLVKVWFSDIYYPFLGLYQLHNDGTINHSFANGTGSLITDVTTLIGAETYLGDAELIELSSGDYLIFDTTYDYYALPAIPDGIFMYVNSEGVLDSKFDSDGFYSFRKDPQMYFNQFYNQISSLHYLNDGNEEYISIVGYDSQEKHVVKYTFSVK